MSKAVFEKIKSFLDEHKISYQVFEHEAVRTSEQAAQVREKMTGVPAQEHLKRGAKAMVLRSKGKFYQFVLSAAKKIDFEKVKYLLYTDRVSMATPEEVQQVLDCVPGSVPPFGNLFNIPVYADKSLLENEYLDFNAGEQTISLSMKKDDWMKAVNPVIEDFS